MTHILMTYIPRSLLFNMEETEIYFDNPHLTAVNVRGEKTVSVRRRSNSFLGCTHSITVAADGAKLPSLPIFKTRQSGSVARKLHQILLSGMLGSIQEKFWIDNRVMSICKDKLWYPHPQKTLKSTLLLDVMKSHIHSEFVDEVNGQGESYSETLRLYTCASAF